MCSKKYINEFCSSNNEYYNIEHNFESKNYKKMDNDKELFEKKLDEFEDFLIEKYKVYNFDSSLIIDKNDFIEMAKFDNYFCTNVSQTVANKIMCFYDEICDLSSGSEKIVLIDLNRENPLSHKLLYFAISKIFSPKEMNAFTITLDEFTDVVRFDKITYSVSIVFDIDVYEATEKEADKYILKKEKEMFNELEQDTICVNVTYPNTSFTEIEGSNISANAYIYTVPLKELVKLYATYGVELFKSNVRIPIIDDGSKGKNQNFALVNDFLSTLIYTPKLFYIYNNGITLLTEKLTTEIDFCGNYTQKLFFKSPQISNGAHSTLISSYIFFTIKILQSLHSSYTEKIGEKCENALKLLPHIKAFDTACILFRVVELNEGITNASSDEINTKVTKALNTQYALNSLQIETLKREFIYLQNYFNSLDSYKKITILSPGYMKKLKTDIEFDVFIKLYRSTIMLSPGSGRNSSVNTLAKLLKNGDNVKSQIYLFTDEKIDETVLMQLTGHMANSGKILPFDVFAMYFNYFNIGEIYPPKIKLTDYFITSEKTNDNFVKYGKHFYFAFLFLNYIGLLTIDNEKKNFYVDSNQKILLDKYLSNKFFLTDFEKLNIAENFLDLDKQLIFDTVNNSINSFILHKKTNVPNFNFETNDFKSDHLFKELINYILT